MFLHPTVEALSHRPIRTLGPIRLGRAADRILTLSFAGLLGVSVWKLDHVDAGRDRPAAIPSRPAESLSTFANALRLLAGSPVVASASTFPQSAPEGWPLWNGDPVDRVPSMRCIASRPSHPAAVTTCESL